MSPRHSTNTLDLRDLSPRKFLVSMHDARSIADIPELMFSVVNFLEVSELVPLMSVSRHFLRIAGQLIWRKVPNIGILMDLIPGAMQKLAAQARCNTHNPRPQIKIILSESLDLTRFNAYAPWVQQLEVFSHMDIYNLQYPRELVNMVAKRPLLPNLRILSLSPNHNILLQDYESPIELFVCPSLVEIRHMTDYCPDYYLGASFAHSLIQRVPLVCSGLRRLDFYPDKDDFLREEYSGLISSPHAAFPRILAGLSNLQSLSSTAFVLKPAVLQALGILPLLESLGILDYDPTAQRSPSLNDDFEVLDTWFPALQTLQIYDLHPRDIASIWSQPPLVQKLHAVTIRCYPGAIDDDQMEPVDGQEWIDTFLSGLPSASPRIEQLDLEFVNLIFDSHMKYSLSNTREDLRQLPLRSTRLQFSSVSLDL